MAEKSFDRMNDVSLKEYYDSTAPKAEAPIAANKNIVCKTCKFAQKNYSGKVLSEKRHPAYVAGTCEKYQEKPKKVYFDGAECPNYQAK